MSSRECFVEREPHRVRNDVRVRARAPRSEELFKKRGPRAVFPGDQVLLVRGARNQDRAPGALGERQKDTGMARRHHDDLSAGEGP